MNKMTLLKSKILLKRFVIRDKLLKKVLVPKIYRNKRISIDHVSNVKDGTKKEIIVNNTFVYNLILNVMNYYKDYEPTSINEC